MAIHSALIQSPAKAATSMSSVSRARTRTCVRATTIPRAPSSLRMKTDAFVPVRGGRPALCREDYPRAASRSLNTRIGRLAVASGRIGR